MRDQFESPLIRRYASKEMSFIFSPQFKFQTWRKLWIYLAESEKELGQYLRHIWSNETLDSSLRPIKTKDIVR